MIMRAGHLVMQNGSNQADLSHRVSLYHQIQQWMKTNRLYSTCMMMKVIHDFTGLKCKTTSLVFFDEQMKIRTRTFHRIVRQSHPPLATISLLAENCKQSETCVCPRANDRFPLLIMAYLPVNRCNKWPVLVS